MKNTPVMMRWMQNGRRPAKPPLRFTECKKLVLRDRVSTNPGSSAELACNPQMIAMLTCLKENDFDQVKCSPSVKAFKDCYSSHLESESRKRLNKNKDEPIPGQNKFTLQQVNSLLKRYPQPR